MIAAKLYNFIRISVLNCSYSKQFRRGRSVMAVGCGIRVFTILLLIYPAYCYIEGLYCGPDNCYDSKLLKYLHESA